jgi:hypothetical protein
MRDSSDVGVVGRGGGGAGVYKHMLERRYRGSCERELVKGDVADGVGVLGGYVSVLAIRSSDSDSQLVCGRFLISNPKSGIAAGRHRHPTESKLVSYGGAPHS